VLPNQTSIITEILTFFTWIVTHWNISISCASINLSHRFSFMKCANVRQKFADRFDEILGRALWPPVCLSLSVTMLQAETGVNESWPGAPEQTTT
jgi:hypothetical protein